MGRLPTFVCPLAPHCAHVQGVTSRFAGSPYERLPNRPSLEDKGQRADKGQPADPRWELSLSQPNPRIRSFGPPSVSLCSSLKLCALQIAMRWWRRRRRRRRRRAETQTMHFAPRPSVRSSTRDPRSLFLANGFGWHLHFLLPAPCARLSERRN